MLDDDDLKPGSDTMEECDDNPFDRPSTDAERALSEHSLLPAPLAPLLLEGVAHSQLIQLAALRIVHGTQLPKWGHQP